MTIAPFGLAEQMFRTGSAGRSCRRRRWLAAAVVAGFACGAATPARAQSYVSPFSIALSSSIAAWTSDFPTRQAAITTYSAPSPANWYSHDYGSLSWGPTNPQLFSTGSIGSPADSTALEFDRGPAVYAVTTNTVPAGVDLVSWQRQRLLAAANTLIGTPYQHLHLPTFDPTLVTGGTGYPWLEVSTNPTLQSSQQLATGVSGTTPNPYAAAYGRPEAGIDCTDLSAYVYNLALGIQMHSGTPDQIGFATGNVPQPGVAATALVLDSAGNRITPQFIYAPQYGTGHINDAAAFPSVVAEFQAGDLLYMGNPNSGILHVVMWLGQTGTDSVGNTFPLVISSHDNTPAIFDTLALGTNGFPLDGDVQGHLPPPGVHILPFDDSNWFYQDFQVAMRVVAVPEPSGLTVVAAALAGIAHLGAGIRRAGRRPPSPTRASDRVASEPVQSCDSGKPCGRAARCKPLNLFYC